MQSVLAGGQLPTGQPIPVAEQNVATAYANELVAMGQAYAQAGLQEITTSINRPLAVNALGPVTQANVAANRIASLDRIHNLAVYDLEDL